MPGILIAQIAVNRQCYGDAEFSWQGF